MFSCAADSTSIPQVQAGEAQRLRQQFRRRFLDANRPAQQDEELLRQHRRLGHQHHQRDARALLWRGQGNQLELRGALHRLPGQDFRARLVTSILII